MSCQIDKIQIDDETIALLLKSAWWDLDDSKLDILGKYADQPALFAQKAIKMKCYTSD